MRVNQTDVWVSKLSTFGFMNVHMKNHSNISFNQKQKHIMDTALKIFAEKGYNGASVRDIALESKVNLAMINYYFGSKLQLLESIFEEKTERAKTYIDAYITDERLSPIEKLEKMIDGYAQFAFENKHFMSLLIRQQLMGGNDKIDEFIFNLKFRYWRILNSALGEAKKNRHFNQNASIITINSLVMGSINHLISDQKFFSNSKGNELENDEIYYEKIVKETIDQTKIILRRYLLDNAVTD